MLQSYLQPEFHWETPNFKYKICPKSKYNLHFLHNRLEFRNQIFIQNFYIRFAAVCKAGTKSTVKLNRKLQILPLSHAATMRNVINSWLLSPAPPYSKPFLRYLGKTSQLSTPIVTRTIFIPQHNINANISSYQLGLTIIKISLKFQMPPFPRYEWKALKRLRPLAPIP